MARVVNSNSNGGSFDQATIDAVWEKGRPADDLPPDQFRFDACNALIEKSKYGDTTEKGYGWEIDHIKPVAHGGGDELSNLQPLQWQNNRAKSDSSTLNCAIKYR